MSCGDPEVVGGSHEGVVALSGGTRPKSTGGDALGGAATHSGHFAWFQHRAFRDRGTTDEELDFALGRALPGDFHTLILCSSRLTDAGVLRALKPHWVDLVDLCIGSDSRTPSSSRITGAALKPLAVAARSLRSLALINVPDAPIASLAGRCDLKSLFVRGQLSVSCVEQLSSFQELEVLKLSLEPRVSNDPFIRVFTTCTRLRIVDIYTATEVSDQLLSCLILHTPRLDEFYGLHTGCHMSAVGGLSPRILGAFKAHFAKSKRIFVDNLWTDSLL
mmetsp:Transcript_80836/g.187674  ORF Transcript_80836/g.187674 Transcript_80836/m.187674 type:complete len:276 (+) Transcript_80836:115-942(+)